MRACCLTWVLAVLVLESGCVTVVDRRIAAHPETWSRLSESDQHRLRQGHVVPGDTAEMVTIALGLPDQELPATGPKGEPRTVWCYEVLELEDPDSLFNPDAFAGFVSSEKRVVLQAGVVVGQPGALSSRTAADWQVDRLDALVALTAKQREQAHAIFAQAHVQLQGIAPAERPRQGMPIRQKMRSDIRALLTPAQQQIYDSTPQRQGGGGRRPAGQALSLPDLRPRHSVRA
jgi:hypothetical protein